jgi:hypothetical protein
MLQVQQITTDASQTQTLILQDGSQLQLSLYYSEQQYGWFFDMTYGSTFILDGIRMTVNPNILRQWKNLIPFGMACFATTSPREPTQIADFASGLFQVFILTADDVEAYETFITSGVSVE